MCGNWKHYVTSDEALFNQGGSHWLREVCYGRRATCDTKFIKCDAFAVGFKSWTGVCFNGKKQR